jgi:subtilase family serine protease
MRLSTLATIVLTSALASSPAAFAQGQGFVNSPGGWEAHPPLHVRPYASTSPVGYVPVQIRHAYLVDLLAASYGGDGAGQVIAIVDAYGSPTAQKDLDFFSSTFGLPTTTGTNTFPFSIIYGTTGKTTTTNAGWALETSLDLQWAHALAPKAKIILAVGKSASLTDLLSAVDAAVTAGATVVSMSWGSSEFSTMANYEYHFQRTGVTFLASSGDNGSGASWPTASPSVVSVGGTTLKLNSNGTYTETAWSGSGGGFSGYFNRPTYQNNWQPNGKGSAEQSGFFKFRLLRVGAGSFLLKRAAGSSSSPVTTGAAGVVCHLFLSVLAAPGRFFHAAGRVRAPITTLARPKSVWS